MAPSVWTLSPTLRRRHPFLLQLYPNLQHIAMQVVLFVVQGHNTRLLTQWQRLRGREEFCKNLNDQHNTDHVKYKRKLLINPTPKVYSKRHNILN